MDPNNTGTATLSLACVNNYNTTCLILGAVYVVNGLILTIIHYKCTTGCMGKCRAGWGIDVNLVIGFLICTITQIVQICFFDCKIDGAVEHDRIGYGFAVALVPVCFIVAGLDLYVLYVRWNMRKSSQLSTCLKSDRQGEKNMC